MEYKKIKEYIVSRFLGKALSELEASSAGRFTGELESLKTAYGYMKDYMLGGADDPSRATLFDNLLVRTYSLLNKMEVEENVGTSGRLFYQKLRTYRALPQLSVSSLTTALEAFAENLAVQKLLGDAQVIGSLCARHDDDRRDLFCLLWLSGEWTDDDRRAADAFFASGLVLTVDKMLAVAGLLLSLMRAFDARKMLAVIALCRAGDPALRARACVTALLVLREYARMAPLFPDVVRAFGLLVDEPSRRDEMLTVMMQLLKALETNKIDRKFNQEIIPELFKKQSELKDRFGAEFIDMNSFNEMKPEWRLEIEKSGIADKLKEINDLQQDGYDIYLGAFAHMKSFTFFGELSNWFLPFDADNAAIRRALPSVGGNGNSVLDMILKAGTLCDSDKYSFCLMLGGVPESQRAMLSSQMGVGEDMGDAALTDADRFAQAANSFVQDLYRFHKLHPQRTQFTDPFDNLADIIGVRLFDAVVGTPDASLALAGTMFKHEHYDTALDYYNRYLSAVRCDDSALFQKAAYCAQRLGRFDEAVRLYTQADSLTPDNKWILSHIASCLALDGKMEEALEYYRLIELTDPSDTSAPLQVCKCMIRMGEFAKALEKLRKLDYLMPDNQHAMRMLGWCLLETADWQGAQSCYDRLAASGARLSANDHVNIGHASWLNGNVRGALDNYVQAARLKDFDWFRSTLDDDISIIERGGIGSADVDIMTDMVFGKVDDKQK